MILLVFLSAGCSRQRPPASDNAAAAAGAYKFPHPKDWSATHLDFIAQNGANLAGTPQDCSRCHDQRAKGPELNVSCALKCHGPTNSEIREGKGLPAPKLNAIVQNSCSKCHASEGHTGTKYSHFPAASGLCTTCHDVSAKHIAGADKAGVTTKSADDSCYKCHARKDTHKVVHPALKINDQPCINCHSPHGTDQRYLLTQASVLEVCTQCHALHEGASVHGAEKIGKNCVNCHQPHSSDQPRMLHKPLNEMCYTCHDQARKTQFAETPRTIPNIKQKLTEFAFPHTGAAGECTTCHNPHSSETNPRLLVDNYSVADNNAYSPPYDPADKKKQNPYGVCLKCHGDTFLTPTDSSSGFRKDEVKPDKTVTSTNLHAFHVVTMGTSCRVCHDPHGTTQAFHINETALGESLTYTTTPSGGTCANACHGPHTYSRAP